MIKTITIILFIILFTNISFSLENKKLIGEWNISLMTKSAVAGSGKLLITKISKKKIATGNMSIAYDNAPMMAAVKLEKNAPVKYVLTAQIEEINLKEGIKTYLHFKCITKKSKEKLKFSVILSEDLKSMVMENETDDFQRLNITKVEKN
jgi:hypothetical protein